MEVIALAKSLVRSWVVCLSLSLVIPAGGSLWIRAQEPTTELATKQLESPSESDPLPLESSKQPHENQPHESSPDQLRTTVAEMILERLPNSYVNEKEWGKTKEVFDGVRLRREGWKLETERKWKRVNDGVWKRYELDLPKDKSAIDLTIDNLELGANNVCQVSLICESPVDAFARVSVWERGVQIVSINADADARVRVRIQAEVAVQLDISRLPPDIVLHPRVISAEVELVSYRLNRVSQLHGPLAKHLGNGLRELIEDRVADANDSLVGKLNRQIDKKRDRLRLSLTKSLTKQWTNWTNWVESNAPREPADHRNSTVDKFVPPLSPAPAPDTSRVSGTNTK